MKSQLFQDLFYLFGLSLNQGKIQFLSFVIFKIGDLQESAKRGEKVQLHPHGWRDVALSDSDISEGVHQFGDPHILRAPFKTSVARVTEPDKLTGKDLLLHSQNGHPNDFPRIVPVRDFPDRTARCTGSTGETPVDMFPSCFLSDEKPKIGIEGLRIDHEILSAVFILNSFQRPVNLKK